MIYTIYDPNTGGITGSGVADPKDISSRLHYIQGRYSAEKYYVDPRTREAVLYPAKPSSNSWVEYIWDFDTKTWIINERKSAANVKQMRSNKLAAVDRINPIWWASMTAEQQAEATAYRQALLDVTHQPGYPVDITWPVKPAWL